jgi:hypothetical protein
VPVSRNADDDAGRPCRKYTTGYRMLDCA